MRKKKHLFLCFVILTKLYYISLNGENKSFYPE